MGAIIIVELMLLALIHFWPATHIPQMRPSVEQPEQDNNTTRIVAITHQSESSSPAPPTPQVPIQVPNDVVVKESIHPFRDLNFSEDSDSLSSKPGGQGVGKGSVDGHPGVPPHVERIVEPTITNQTQQKKADIWVRFLVNKKGGVDTVSVAKILRYKNGSPSERINHINPDIMHAILKAAMQWKFHPARDHGHPVRAYSLQVFTVAY